MVREGAVALDMWTCLEDVRRVACPRGTTSQVFSSRILWNILFESQAIQLAIMDIFLDFFF